MSSYSDDENHGMAYKHEKNGEGSPRSLRSDSHSPGIIDRAVSRSSSRGSASPRKVEEKYIEIKKQNSDDQMDGIESSPKVVDKSTRESEDDEEKSGSKNNGKSRSRSRSTSRDTKRRHSQKSRSRSKSQKRSRSRSSSRRQRSRSSRRSTSRTRRRSRSPQRRTRQSRSRGRRSRSRSVTPVDGARLHVAELDVETRKKDLEKLFEKYGRLREIWMARNPPCFAFVVFQRQKDADRALRETDGIPIGHCRIKVTQARPRVRGGRFRGGGGYDPNLRCYQCGELGHFSRNCTDTKFGYKRPPTPQGGRSSGGRASGARRRSRSRSRRSRS